MKRYDEIHGGKMNKKTDSDVLMRAAAAATEQQLLTETETKQPKSAPTASIGQNKLFSVTELLGAAPMKFYLAVRMELIELRNTWIAWKTWSALRKQPAAAAANAREEELQGYVGLISIAEIGRASCRERV